MNTSCWTLNVMQAFAEQMDAVKPDAVPPTLIGWPHLAMAEGPWAPFVWFDTDVVDSIDGGSNHQLTVVTGVVMRKDPSKTDQTELEQAITTYYAMRAAIDDALELETSPMNKAFTGHGQTHPEQGGVRPSGANDFDGHSTLGERWLVVGNSGLTGALTS